MIDASHGEPEAAPEGRAPGAKRGVDPMLVFVAAALALLLLDQGVRLAQGRGAVTALGIVFGPVLGGDSAARKKPAPDLLLMAAERLGVSPADCMMVGDSDVDIAAAIPARNWSRAATPASVSAAGSGAGSVQEASML